METNLTIQEKLKDLRVEKKLTLEKLSEIVGISTSTLGKYESNDFKDISHSYLLTLAKYYNVSADWLLGLSESREIQNHEIAELQLDDETLEILKSGSLNNRLLCEMIKHPDFIKLMTDTEIYVDGIATMQIRNMNDWLDAVHLQIMLYLLQLLLLTSMINVCNAFLLPSSSRVIPSRIFGEYSVRNLNSIMINFPRKNISL